MWNSPVPLFDCSAFHFIHIGPLNINTQDSGSWLIDFHILQNKSLLSTNISLQDTRTRWVSGLLSPLNTSSWWVIASGLSTFPEMSTLQWRQPPIAVVKWAMPISNQSTHFNSVNIHSSSEPSKIYSSQKRVSDAPFQAGGASLLIWHLSRASSGFFFKTRFQDLITRSDLHGPWIFKVSEVKSTALWHDRLSKQVGPPATPHHSLPLWHLNVPEV